jgi:hypothetical protein
MQSANGWKAAILPWLRRLRRDLQHEVKFPGNLTAGYSVYAVGRDRRPLDSKVKVKTVRIFLLVGHHQVIMAQNE